ncbi:MAG: HXXEE domain-containing protein [Methanobacterium sp. ERen5]|nr:MAG: HXXEE domain-containing protein [Methanobacterium sp. ERen5]
MERNYNPILQFVGAFLGPIVLTLLICIKVVNPSFTWLAFLYWALFPLYLLHETEEYVIRGDFGEWVNTKSGLTVDPPRKDFPMTPGYQLALNLMAWLWPILGGLTVAITPWIGMGWVVLLFVMNSFMHLAGFQIKNKGANPGFYTTWLLLTPFQVVVVFYAWYTNALTSLDWILSIILGVGLFLFFLSVTRRRISLYMKE